MSFSSGTFSINTSGQPVVTGTVISSTAFNALTADLATGLSTCVLKDGTQTITANIPMSAFKFTGLAAGTTNGDSVRFEQLASTVAPYLPLAGGTMSGALKTPDNLMQIVGSSDATKIAVFEVDGLSASTTRTYTLQDSNDTLVGRATTDTLTNKTISVAGTGNVITNSIVGTPVATTSGSTVNISTTIPANVRSMVLGFKGVSTNGTNKIQVQLSNGGVFVTSGYLGSNAGAAYSGGFDINTASASNLIQGIMVFWLIDSATNSWGASIAGLSLSNTAGVFAGGGYVPLSGVVDGIRVTTADTWDGGTITLIYGF